jgi:adenylate cyclase
VEIDPHYAQAWALLAMAQSSLRYVYSQDIDDGFAAANAALAIDPAIAEAHLPMFKRLHKRGKIDAAARELDTAIRLGPDSWEVNKEAGRFYLFERRDVDAATRHYEKAAELMETDFHAWGMLTTCYQAQGERAKLREAAKMMVSEAHRAVQQDPSNGAALGILAGGYALLGEKNKAREWIDRALLVDPDNLNMRYNFACVLSLMGDKDQSLKMLETTIPRVELDQLAIAECDPDLDALRDDPRFGAIIEAAKKRLGIGTIPLSAAPEVNG